MDVKELPLKDYFALVLISLFLSPLNLLHLRCKNTICKVFSGDEAVVVNKTKSIPVPKKRDRHLTSGIVGETGIYKYIKHHKLL